MLTLKMDVMSLLNWMCELFASNCELVDKLLGNEFAGSIIRDTIGMNENQSWDEYTVTKLFTIVGAYVSGAALLDVERGLKVKIDSYLKTARVFAIKVIP